MAIASSERQRAATRAARGEHESMARLSTCPPPFELRDLDVDERKPVDRTEGDAGPGDIRERGDRMSSAGVPSRSQLEPADELSAFIGLPGHDHGIDVLDDGRSSDAVACRRGWGSAARPR